MNLHQDADIIAFCVAIVVVGSCVTMFLISKAAPADCSLGFTEKQIFGHNVCKPIAKPKRKECGSGFFEQWQPHQGAYYCVPGYKLEG